MEVPEYRLSENFIVPYVDNVYSKDIIADRRKAREPYGGLFTSLTSLSSRWLRVSTFRHLFFRLIIKTSNPLTIKDGHSAWNIMCWVFVILCAGCTKWDAHGAHVVHKHIWTSLVYTLQCHSYTTSSFTNILSSMSLIYSLLCQGYTRSCLRGILTSAYGVFSILRKGYPQRVYLALRSIVLQDLVF